MFWNRKPAPSTEAEFDIEGMDVFSVERDDTGETRFGYRRTETVFAAEGIAKERTVEDEWIVMSTDEQHRAFVARLTKKIQVRTAAKENE